MKNINNSLNYNVIESRSPIFHRLKSFVLKPIFVGLFTFSIFFTTILITKVATYLLVEGSFFSLNIYDVLFAWIGFGVGFLVEFLLQVRRIFYKQKKPIDI